MWECYRVNSFMSVITIQVLGMEDKIQQDCYPFPSRFLSLSLVIHYKLAVSSTLCMEVTIIIHLYDRRAKASRAETNRLVTNRGETSRGHPGRRHTQRMSFDYTQEERDGKLWEQQQQKHLRISIHTWVKLRVYKGTPREPTIHYISSLKVYKQTTSISYTLSSFNLRVFIITVTSPTPRRYRC